MSGWTFGISEVTTWPWSFAEDGARYPELGAAAIEVWQFKLASDPARRRDQLATMRARGLCVCSFQANVHSLYPTRMQPRPTGFEERCAAFVAILDELAPLLPGTVFVLNTGIAPDGNVEQAFHRTVPAYRELARRAAAAGVRLAIEPLHPLAMNEDTFAWSLADARQIVEAVAHDAFGICADVWNLAGQHDVQRELAACQGAIFLAQVADYRRPRSFLDRVGIGDGTIDFGPFLAGLRDAAYAGPLVLELFSRQVPDSLYERDLHDVVVRSRNALTRLAGSSLRVGH